MSFCTNCGQSLKPEAKFCGKCGTENPPMQDNISVDIKQNVGSGNTLQRPPEWKSMGVTIVLTVVLGILGFGGIGHIYLGKIIKGIVVLIVGIILLVVTIFTMGIGLIGLIPFAIWVVYDSYKLCKYYNNNLEQTGKSPW